jgi:carboxymethylenebutenolidase
MPKVIERIMTPEQDGLPGYLAYPERSEPGPALMLIHQNTGVSGYIKIEAQKYAALGYTTVIPNLYEMCGFPDQTHLVSGPIAQRQISDAQFVEACTVGWRYLLGRDDVDPERVAVGGYCMGGRIAIHFLAATSNVKAFVGYYPTVRDEPTTELRPVHPVDAVADIRCPSIILYGADDHITRLPVQEKLWQAFNANGQRLEWHYFPFGGHGYADPDTAGYWPHAAELSWPLVVDFLRRELDNY